MAQYLLFYTYSYIARIIVKAKPVTNLIKAKNTTIALIKLGAIMKNTFKIKPSQDKRQLSKIKVIISCKT